MSLGLYSVDKGERVELDAKALDHRAYDMGTLLIEIPPQDLTIQYAKGWYDPESVPTDVSAHWRWTKKDAVLKVRIRWRIRCCISKRMATPIVSRIHRKWSPSRSVTT